MTFDLSAGVAVLERTPRVLDALLSGLPEGWTRGHEGVDTWSPFDVVGHLIDGELTDWMTRLHIILKQGSNRRFESFDRFHHISRNKDRALGDDLPRQLWRPARLRADRCELRIWIHLRPS